MAVLLAFSGKAKSGKNASASFAQEWAASRGISYAERGFADLVKLSAARLFFPDIGMRDAIAWADYLKFNGYVKMYTVGKARATITGRQLLQRMGTESHRDVFGENFWVDQLLPLAHSARIDWREDNFANADLCVISDLRFPNEARRVHGLGGHVIMVEGGQSEEGDGHASEQGDIPHDIALRIRNEGTLEDLKGKVYTLMDYMHQTRIDWTLPE